MNVLKELKDASEWTARRIEIGEGRSEVVHLNWETRRILDEHCGFLRISRTKFTALAIRRLSRQIKKAKRLQGRKERNANR